MKKFTVKDFIEYNGPCFSCGGQINFKIGFVDLDAKQTPTMADASYLRPLVTTNHTEVDLIIKYSNQEALKLQILHKTNKIFTNNSQGLTKYLSRHKLFLSSQCDKCHTQIESNFLEINLNKGFIEAVTISTERLVVMSDDTIYQLYSSAFDNKTKVVVDRLDRIAHTFNLDLPFLPKYRFRTRDNLISKIKMYMTFS